MKSDAFYVVCVCGNLVEHRAYWETSPSDKAHHIADTVARATERFGSSGFEVIVVSIGG